MWDMHHINGQPCSRAINNAINLGIIYVMSNHESSSLSFLKLFKFLHVHMYT